MSTSFNRGYYGLPFIWYTSKTHVYLTPQPGSVFASDLSAKVIGSDKSALVVGTDLSAKIIAVDYIPQEN